MASTVNTAFYPTETSLEPDINFVEIDQKFDQQIQSHLQRASFLSSGLTGQRRQNLLRSLEWTLQSEKQEALKEVAKLRLSNAPVKQFEIHQKFDRLAEDFLSKCLQSETTQYENALQLTQIFDKTAAKFRSMASSNSEERNRLFTQESDSPLVEFGRIVKTAFIPDFSAPKGGESIEGESPLLKLGRIAKNALLPDFEEMTRQKKVHATKQTLLKHPEVQKLWQHAQEQFENPIVLKAVPPEEDPLRCSFGFQETTKGKLINPEIKVNDKLNDIDLKLCIVLEIANLSLAHEYTALGQRAMDHSISKEDYVREKEEIECSTENITFPIYEDLKKSGIMPPSTAIHYTNPKNENILTDKLRKLRDDHLKDCEADFNTK
jgi:hypothetical protein